MQIQNLHLDDLELFYKYAKEEHWDIEDPHIRALLKTHPEDFFIFYEDSELVGFVVAIKENEELGFISSLLVLKEFRSLGYGKKIFTFACEHLGERQIGLDSVLGQEIFYEKFNFKRYFDVNTYQFQTGKFSINSDTYSIIDFDKELCLSNQTEFLKELLVNEDLDYKAIIEEGVVSSFAFSFHYKDGYKVTIHTQDVNHGAALFFALCKDYIHHTAIYIQTTKVDSLLEALAQALEMKQVSYTTRMYNKIL
ncbi:MAG TPA: N-acetyltransferase [Sulfurimonas sp.]|nr:N-acetyltransferase [Sulfurimonas sp.]